MQQETISLSIGLIGLLITQGVSIWKFTQLHNKGVKEREATKKLLVDHDTWEHDTQADLNNKIETTQKEIKDSLENGLLSEVKAIRSTVSEVQQVKLTLLDLKHDIRLVRDRQHEFANMLTGLGLAIDPDKINEIMKKYSPDKS